MVVVGKGGKTVHEGLHPENAIIESLGKMLRLAANEEIPSVYRAIITHYIFEYIHPFYDGNGRTGRYLLSLYLGESLSPLTSLSVSRSIHANKDAYYKSFKSTQSSMNRGEMTHFVLTMLANIHEAQGRLVVDLEAKREQLDEAREKIEALRIGADIPKHQLDILYVLAQAELYSAGSSMLLDEIASTIGLGTQQTRKHLTALEKNGLVAPATRRPLRFKLADGFLDQQ